MFLLVDKDGNGFVGFEEFLDLFQILSSVEFLKLKCLSHINH
jgi:hypothetical protein